jgi:hypothetical protein
MVASTHALLKTTSEGKGKLIAFCSWNFMRVSHRVAHSARVNVYGIPFIREMPKITGVSGSDLVIKCPVAGYPIDKIHWERGKQLTGNRYEPEWMYLEHSFKLAFIEGASS